MAATAHKRPWWLRILRTVALLLALLLLTAASGAWWLLGTASGARWLVGTALPYAQEVMPDNMQLDVQDIDADTIASLRIGALRLSDADGIWFAADKLALQWHPAALWHGTVDIQEFSAAKLHYIRPPLSEESPPLNPQQQVQALQETLRSLPDTLHGIALPPLRLNSLRIDTLTLESLGTPEPLNFSVMGKADLTQAPAQLNLQLDSTDGPDTHATIALRGDMQDATLQLQWQEASNGLIGSLIQLQTAASLSLNAHAAMDAGQLHTQIAATTAEQPLLTGELQLPIANDTPLSAETTLPQPALLQPLQSFSAPLHIKASLSDDTLSAQLDTAALAMNEQQLTELQLSASLGFDDSPDYALQAKAAALLAQPEQGPLPLRIALNAKGDEAVWNIASLELEATDIAKASLNGKIDLEDGEAEVEGRASAPQADIRLAASVANLWQQPEGTARVILDSLNIPLSPPLDKVVQLPLTLTAQTEQTDAALPDVAWTLESTALNGKGMVHPAAQEQQPLATADLNIGGLPLPLAVQASYLVDGSGHVDAQSKTLAAATDYRLSDSEVLLSGLSLKSGDALNLNGDIHIDTTSTLASGDLKGYLRSTAPLNDLGISTPNITLSKGSIALRLAAPKGVQTAALVADAGSLTLDGSTMAQEVQLDALVQLPPNASPALDATLSISELTSPVALASAKLTAKGGLDELDWTARLTHDENNSLSSKGTLEYKEALALTIAALDIAWQGNTIALAKPAQLQYSETAITADDIALLLNGTPTLTANADLRNDAVKAQLNLTGLPLRSVPALAEVAGDIEGEVTLSGTPKSPAANWKFTVDGLQQNYPEMTYLREQPLVMTLRGALQNQEITSQLSVNAPDAESHGGANVSLPVAVSLAPSDFYFRPGETIEAALSADLQLAPFLPLALPDGIYGAGHMKADMTMKGALSSPQLNGTLTLEDGQIEVLQAGTTINKLGMKVTAQNGLVTIRDGSATDGGTGTLDFSGDVKLEPTLPMDMKTEFKQFVALRHPSATATLSGAQTLKGDLSDALLKGELHIDSAKITIKRSGNTDVIELPVIEVTSLDDPLEELPNPEELTEEERNARQEQRRRERPFARNLALDVTIGADNQIFLDGFGLTAELKGEVKVGGNAARPEMGGKMSTVRGRWEFFGRTFNITRGEAILSEDNLTAPLINIRAEADADDVRAIAQISGTTSNPKIEFSSIPALPKDEILSRVMFGENLNNISPYQALQLADMLRSLSGSGDGASLNPLSALQDTLGIDELKINNESGNSEDVTVGVGKYVQENVYLEVEGGAAENSGKVSLEVDLTSSISVETEARQNAESAVRLNYKYDY